MKGASHAAHHAAAVGEEIRSAHRRSHHIGSGRRTSVSSQVRQRGVPAKANVTISEAALHRFHSLRLSRPVPTCSPRDEEERLRWVEQCCHDETLARERQLRSPPAELVHDHCRRTRVGADRSEVVAARMPAQMRDDLGPGSATPTRHTTARSPAATP